MSGTSVDVGFIVGVGDEGVNVSVTGSDEIIGTTVGVGRAERGTGAIVLHAERVVINNKNAIRTCINFTARTYKLFKISVRFSSYSLSLIKLFARSSFKSFILANT